MGVSLVECRVERGCEASCEVSAKREQSMKLVRQCEPARLGRNAGVERRCGITVDCVRSRRRADPFFCLCKVCARLCRVCTGVTLQALLHQSKSGVLRRTRSVVMFVRCDAATLLIQAKSGVLQVQI